MNSKRILFILFVILSQALAACGAAPPAAEPTTAPPPAPTPTLEPADPAEIAQAFYKALDEGDLEAAMALVADDIKCRGSCYITGKESFRSWIQGGINSGGRVEISDLVVEGDTVSYNWTAYNANGVFAARGVETLQIKDGKIILMQSEAQ